MQLAIARADIALDPAVFQEMPVTSKLALNTLIHVATGLCLRDPSVNW
jgi:hypothetical protein